MVATVTVRDGIRHIDISGSGTNGSPTNGPLVPGADNEPERSTYSFSVGSFVPAATPTDIFTLQGSATKVILLKSIILAGSASAATNVLFNIYRRTTANTGGTATTPSIAAHDLNDAPATAVVSQYSANPAGLGTGSLLHVTRLNLAPAANGSIDRVALQYTWQNDKAPILRGISQWFAINVGGVAWPGSGLLDVDILWTEE